MKNNINISIHKTIRSLHRDIGFFVIGLTIIYCISGVFLTYRDTGFLKSEMLIEKTIAQGLNGDDLGHFLHRKVKVTDENDSEIVFESGTYNKETGAVSFTSNELPLVLRKFTQLHSNSSHDPKHWFTITFGALLFFLAISSFWMYKPGTRLFRRGILTASGGSVIAFLLVLF